MQDHAAESERAARLQLAQVLLHAGNNAGALEQFAAVLGQNPTDTDALAGAAMCCDALGDSRRAAEYRRILSALGTSAPDDTMKASAESSELGDEVIPPAESPPQLDTSWLRPRLRMVPEPEPGDSVPAAEVSVTTLEDVAGMEAVKRRLNTAFLGPLRNPELRSLYGKSLRGGLLLFGPPGCGKTFLARATAGELGAKFISVGLFDVLDMWLGESERHIHEIFESVRRSAPAVLFFDEIDGLGRKRSQLKYSGGRTLVNQLLAELDGVDAANDGIFVLGASNSPWDVDPALLRPGRFDRLILVLPPDEKARAAILRLHLRGRPADDVDVPWIAARTPGFSGADLAHLCESAAEIAMEASLAAAKIRPITTTDFKTCLRDLKPSTRQWFETARNYVMFANEGGQYDELLAYMRTNKLL